MSVFDVPFDETPRSYVTARFLVMVMPWTFELLTPPVILINTVWLSHFMYSSTSCLLVWCNTLQFCWFWAVCVDERRYLLCLSIILPWPSRGDDECVKHALYFVTFGEGSDPEDTSSVENKLKTISSIIWMQLYLFGISPCKLTVLKGQCSFQRIDMLTFAGRLSNIEPSYHQGIPIFSV